jgi:hypothetical protein
VLAHKLTKLVIVLIPMAAPFVVWLGLYAASRFASLNLRPAVAWLRVLRWTTWGAAVCLFFAHIANDRFPFVYAAAGFIFSQGLFFPEGWVKRRFAPELVAPAESPDGWWPSKGE